ncbi:hypothetical protein HY212_03895 [Candidatus Pacearchaeota archaeon]|nr:hypothetical protein [Candidatus Pacearchaeota archaeon]
MILSLLLLITGCVERDTNSPAGVLSMAWHYMIDLNDSQKLSTLLDGDTKNAYGNKSGMMKVKNKMAIHESIQYDLAPLSIPGKQEPPSYVSCAIYNFKVTGTSVISRDEEGNPIDIKKSLIGEGQIRCQLEDKIISDQHELVERDCKITAFKLAN